MPGITMFAGIVRTKPGPTRNPSSFCFDEPFSCYPESVLGEDVGCSYLREE